MRGGDLSLSQSLENLQKRKPSSKPTTATHEIQLKINNIELKKQGVNVDIQRILHQNNIKL